MTSVTKITGGDSFNCPEPIFYTSANELVRRLVLISDSGGSKAINVLKKYLESKRLNYNNDSRNIQMIRGWAAYLLGNIGDEAVADYLKNMLDCETNDHVKQAIQKAIEEIDSRGGKSPACNLDDKTRYVDQSNEFVPQALRSDALVRHLASRTTKQLVHYLTTDIPKLTAFILGEFVREERSWNEIGDLVVSYFTNPNEDLRVRLTALDVISIRISEGEKLKEVLIRVFNNENEDPLLRLKLFFVLKGLKDDEILKQLNGVNPVDLKNKFLQSPALGPLDAEEILRELGINVPN